MTEETKPLNIDAFESWSFAAAEEWERACRIGAATAMQVFQEDFRLALWKVDNGKGADFELSPGFSGDDGDDMPSLPTVTLSEMLLKRLGSEEERRAVLDVLAAITERVKKAPLAR